MHDANVRRVQIACLVMLAVSTAQVMWWVLDQSFEARSNHAQWLASYQDDVKHAEEMLSLGALRATVAASFPQLEIKEKSVSISQETLDELAHERRGHVNQYAWEGAFFMVVLLGSMSVVWRAVRRESQLRRWQDNFLAAVTHELKSPLASLQLAAETLSMRQLSAERQSVLVSRILADTERLGGTVANVLDTHRLDQQAVSLERRPIDLRQYVTETAAELAFLARDAGVEVKVEIPEALVFTADPVGVRTVLRNLLDNAVKASQDDDGGQVRITAKGAGQSVLLEIRDDGVGFVPEEGERLFQKFYRVGDEMRRTRTGSGLGLYLTRGFVELEGGSIEASSQGPGQGATFTVEWPVGRES